MKKLLFTILFIASIAYTEAPVQWQVFFTSPTEKVSGIINPEKGLIDAIRSAEESFYGSFYDISSLLITSELIDAKKRNVDVKLITEKDNYSGKAINYLIEAGIPIIRDNSHGLMHNKFAVIDKKILFTGSYNITDNGSSRNNNNAIIIESKKLASIYLAKFNEMFQHKVFGNKKKHGPFAHLRSKNKITTPDISLEVYFSPEDKVEDIICKKIKDAADTIRFMAFSFTSSEISEAMIKKHKAGIDVKGIFEKRGAYTRHSEFIKMKLEGLPVQVDNNRYNMHHKVIIIDDNCVITGSYNFSKNASLRNEENILIIYNNDIAGLFIDEFNRLSRKRK